MHIRPLLSLTRFKRAIAVILVLASALFFLGACGSGSQAGQSSHSEASGGQGSFPVKIDHVYGTTSIPAKPKRIATVGWATPDNLIALGVVPVSIQKNSFGKTVDGGYLPWTKDALDEMHVAKADMPKLHDESDGIDVEAIAASKPDLIIGLLSGMTKKQYDTLSKIAPTVAYQKVAWGDPWRKVITATAQAIGEPEKGKQLITDLEERIAKAAEAHPAIKGKTGVVMYFDASKLSKFSVYTTSDARPQFLNDLGMETPESIKEDSKGTKNFYKEISSEHADRYKDVDIIVTYGTPDLLEAMRKDPLLSKIPAVERGSVVVIDSDGEMANALDPSALSIQKTTDAYAGLLGEAASKV